MNIEDAKKPTPRKGKMPSAPIKAPQGNIKGIGPMGIYTGGLDPLVVKPTPGLKPRQVAGAVLGRQGKP